MENGLEQKLSHKNQQLHRENIRDSIGFIFDMDGVVTASPHEESWRRSVRIFYNVPELEFTTQDYHNLSSGVPRKESARNVLEKYKNSHGLEFDDSSVDRLCDLKQSTFMSMINNNEFDVYDSTVLLMLEVKKKNNLVAIASSSANAGTLLSKIKIAEVLSRAKYHSGECELYREMVCKDIIDYGIYGGITPGKPNPKIFFEAAKGIHKEVSECIVFEDAISGVKAANAGGFYCVGLRRDGMKAEDLLKAGANIVFDDISQTNQGDILEHFLATKKPNAVLVSGLGSYCNNARTTSNELSLRGDAI